MLFCLGFGATFTARVKLDSPHAHSEGGSIWK